MLIKLLLMVILLFHICHDFIFIINSLSSLKSVILNVVLLRYFSNSSFKRVPKFIFCIKNGNVSYSFTISKYDLLNKVLKFLYNNYFELTSTFINSNNDIVYNFKSSVAYNFSFIDSSLISFLNSNSIYYSVFGSNSLKNVMSRPLLLLLVFIIPFKGVVT
jgi:hypothetical protein